MRRELPNKLLGKPKRMAKTTTKIWKTAPALTEAGLAEVSPVLRLLKAVLDLKAPRTKEVRQAPSVKVLAKVEVEWALPIVTNNMRTRIWKMSMKMESMRTFSTRAK